MNYFQKNKEIGFSYDWAKIASVTCTDRSKPALPRRIPSDNTTKTGVSAATIGRVIAAVRGQQNDTGRNRTTTHRATRGKCSPNCTNPHTTATHCLSYRTTHSYLPRSSQPDSSAGTHRYSLRSRPSLAVRFQSLPPLRNNYRLRAAAATSCPTDKALSWSFSLRAYSRVQNPIRLLRSIPGRSVACSAYPRAAPQNRALASSAMRKTHLHRPSLRLRPDPSVLG